MQQNIEKVSKGAKIRESMQSSTTPDPGYQWESDNITARHHKRDMYMRGLVPRNLAELAETVPIGGLVFSLGLLHFLVILTYSFSGPCNSATKSKYTNSSLYHTP